MELLTLEGATWRLGEHFGSGGFARVHDAVSPDGEPAVLKLIPKDPGAKRELLLDELAGTPNVIPVLATGEHGDFWVLGMPRAEMSLREYVRGSPISEPSDAVAILRDVVEALAQLDGRVVHRDLKPENILLWQGTWCLADFGIARYAEQTTAADTRKFAMSSAYAAPEQWRFERATGATDVYALGVIAYELLCGSRPFPGPNREDFREQHLQQPAPRLENVPANLGGIVASCLLKAPEARPRPNDLLRQLQVDRPAAVGAAARLQQVNLDAVQRAAEESAAAEAERTATQRRQSLYEAAEAELQVIHDSLRAQLREHAPTAAPSGGRGWPFELNGASLNWVPAADASRSEWGHYQPAFEVIADAGIELTIPPRSDDYVGRAHSLWYCDAQEKGTFRWYETAFMIMALSSRRTRGNPVMLKPGADAGGAVSNVVTLWQLAWPFTPIDRGESGDFIERWLGWFADAAQGKLRHPSQMPERETRGSYRS